MNLYSVSIKGKDGTTRVSFVKAKKAKALKKTGKYDSVTFVREATVCEDQYGNKYY